MSYISAFDPPPMGRAASICRAMTTTKAELEQDRTDSAAPAAMEKALPGATSRAQGAAPSSMTVGVPR